MATHDEALVAETRALIGEVEAGETTRAAWIAIRDRLRRLGEDRTQAEVGRLLDKSRSWVKDVVDWEPGERRPTPFGGDFRATVRREEVGARSVLRDPDRREKVLSGLDPSERTEIATTAVRGLEPKQRDAVRDSILGEEAKGGRDLGAARKRVAKREFSEEARACVDRAFRATGDRIHYYGDVPLTDWEVQQLRWTKQMIDSLVSGADIDSELKELLDESRR